MIQLAPRQIILASALVLTLAAVAWVATRDDGNDAQDDLASPSRAGKLASQPQLAMPLQVDKLAQVQPKAQPAGEQDIVDLFKPHVWYVPPPPPAPINTVAEVAVAPPIPFVYMGRLDGVVFLTRNNLVVSASEGEMLDSQYRLDKVNANSLVITYLPLDIKQTMVIKGAS